jgi:hypothetical protein
MASSLIVLALLFSAAIVHGTGNAKCGFVADDGSSYDLSPLEGSAPYTFSDVNQNTYFIDFCDDTRSGCSETSAVCLLTRDGHYRNLGSPDGALFSKLPRDQGVEITYASQETCSNGRTRKTTVLLNCSPERLTLDFIKKPDDCFTIVSMFSQYGCPAMNITEDEAEFCGQFSTKDDCFSYSGCNCGWCDEQCVSTKYEDHCESYEFACEKRRLTAGMVFAMTVFVLTFMLFAFACCLCCCYKSRRAAHYRQLAAATTSVESNNTTVDVSQEDEDLARAIEMSKVESQPTQQVEEPSAPQDASQPVFVYQPLMPQFVSPLQYAQYAHFQFMNANQQQPVQYPFFFQPQVQMPQSETQDQ